MGDVINRRHALPPRKMRLMPSPSFHRTRV
jgi:hypothetical protein